jgi:S1-C subfamily serine protease
MRRTLLEIVGGVVAVVVMASLHHQIARLEVRQGDVAQLRVMVAEATRRADSRVDVEQLRAELTHLVEARFDAIESRVEEARREAEGASSLGQEVELARREAALVRAEMTRDVRQTRELLKTYRDELSARDSDVLARTEQTRQHVEALFGRVAPDPRLLSRELLAPTVQLNGTETVGSGTIIKSVRDDRTGKAETWILTAYHVVRNILADSPRAVREGIAVTVYTEQDGRVEVRADLVAHEHEIDAALLRVRDDRVFDSVAHVLPRHEFPRVRVWDEIYAIGCPLGNDPIPTKGAISSMHNMLSGTNYWMINAPTYYGNSGGGVFLADSRELIGVFSKIYTHGRGTPVVIPHMGLCTPIESIYRWLEKEELLQVLSQPAELEADLANLAAPAK